MRWGKRVVWDSRGDDVHLWTAPSVFRWVIFIYWTKPTSPHCNLIGADNLTTCLLEVFGNPNTLKNQEQVNCEKEERIIIQHDYSSEKIWERNTNTLKTRWTSFLVWIFEKNLNGFLFWDFDFTPNNPSQTVWKQNQVIFLFCSLVSETFRLIKLRLSTQKNNYLT